MLNGLRLRRERKCLALSLIICSHIVESFVPLSHPAILVKQTVKQSSPCSFFLDNVKFDSSTQLGMEKKSEDRIIQKQMNRAVPLSAFTTATMPYEGDTTNSILMPKSKSFDIESISAVISSALLITGNTVGAGTIVLPEIATGPGMLPSTGLFLGIFLTNLVSGLMIGEIAIKQYEENEDISKPPPSSFKDLADNLLNYEGINGGQIVSLISILVNYCVLTFALSRAGHVAVDVATFFNVGEAATLSQPMFSAAFSAVVIGLISTQGSKTLSQIASGAVFLLFLSFGSILMPGLMNMQHDVLTTLTTPGTCMSDPSTNLLDSMSTAAPIFVTTMIYQNIVPTVTKLLGYDRKKITAAILMGSGLPVMMYIAWCFAVLGGGVSLNSMGEGAGLESMVLLLFSVAAIGGSSIGCVMSLAAELKSQLATLASKNGLASASQSPFSKSDSLQDDSNFSLPPVALAVIPPLLVGLLLSNGEGMTMALKVSGSYLSPTLYGILPAFLAWKQEELFVEPMFKEKEMIPGGIFSQAMLSMCAIGFIGHALVGDISSLF